MQLTRLCGLVLMLMISATFVDAQDAVAKKEGDKKAKSADKAKPADGPLEFDVIFSDNSNVKVVVLDTNAVITTRYGKLTVPFSELRRVDLGIRYPAGVEAKIETAVTKLVSDSIPEREEAEKALAGYKELALPALRNATKNGTTELARRAEEVLKTLTRVLPEDRVNLKDQDTIETREFTIRGKLETASIKVKTKQFGDTNLKIEELRSMRAIAGASMSEVTVDANKYAKLNYTNWFDTGLDVQPGHVLEISASGTIDLLPIQQGQQTSTPGGGTISTQGPQGFTTTHSSSSGNIRNTSLVKTGALIGRIGTNGTPFLVGANYKHAANAEGRLFLIIAPSSWGMDPTGSYKVKIKVGE